MRNRTGSTGTLPGNEERETAAFTSGARGEKTHYEGFTTHPTE